MKKSQRKQQSYHYKTVPNFTHKHPWNTSMQWINGQLFQSSIKYLSLKQAVLINQWHVT